MGFNSVFKGLIYFLGNTSNGGMECPVGLVQLTTVTRDPRSADWTQDIWCIPFNPNIFMCLCCTIVMPVSSQLQSLTGLCLTLILLTRRIWWAPTNASKWQMGFNSAFKGLMVYIAGS